MKICKILLLALTILSLSSCNQGDTGGGLQQAFPGSVLVGDQNNGLASLRINADTNVPLGGTIEYTVEARGADGGPLSFLPISCDTEVCLSVVEPNQTVNGTAGIANTSSGGVMSGVLGGSCPGSFIMECRGPAGSGLVARMGFRVSGTAPSGFNGFAGAAGGGLGGGSSATGGDTTGGTVTGGDTTGGTTGGDTTDGDMTDVISQVGTVTFNDALFRTVSGEGQTGEIDTFRNPDCDGDGNDAGDPDADPPIPPGSDDPEPFTNDFAVFNISNNRTSQIQIDTVTYSVQGVVTSTFTQLSQVIIPANSTNTTFEALFTDLVAGGKEYVGTNLLITEVTTNVTFTITGTNIDGSEPFTLLRSGVIAADSYNLCPSS